ncbi:MAG TPA: PAS domain-containing protein [Myxococcaceae bacterium]|jgi:PAS domain S-box-containing protein
MLSSHALGGGHEVNEEQRLRALYRYGLLDGPPDPEYDTLVQLTAELCQVPIALMALVDREHLWIKAQVGDTLMARLERASSFCTHVIKQEGVFCVEDLRQDTRFRDNPSVTGEPFARFYAGVPVHSEDGFRIGTLCVLDHTPRRLSASQQRALEHLARQLETRLHLRLQLQQAQERNAELEEARGRLHALNQSLQTEIHERRRIERELRAQRELFKSVLTHIPYSIFWKDRQGVFQGCNEAFARMVGRASPEEIIGGTDHDLGFPAKQIEAYRRDDLQVLDSGEPKLSIEEPIRGSGGVERWLLTSKVPLRDPEGQLWAVLGIFADITERKQQEAALEQALRQVEQYATRLETQVYTARERIRRLMETSLDAVFVLDEQGRILELNPVAQQLVGQPGTQLLGTAFASLAPEPEQPPLRAALEELLNRGPLRLEDQGLRSASGKRVALQIVGSLQAAGDSRRLLLVAHDLTEKRRLEQQSIQNDRLMAMGVLAAGIAHEINNPSAYVLANLDYLRMRWAELEAHWATQSPLPPALAKALAPVRELIADCIDGCTRIQDIVRGMRYLSYQGEDDSLCLLDIHATLDSVLHIAQGELKQTARLEKDYAAALPQVLGNEGRLGQVFLNLVINAVHAMQPGPPSEHLLRVSTRREGDRVRISISDTGHGISPEVLPRIFDPFFTTKPAGVGTGLGLSISHAIVQKMDGELQVESRVGQGTTFSLLLPAHR